jgi:hypothetical protein
MNFSADGGGDVSGASGGFIGLVPSFSDPATVIAGGITTIAVLLAMSA